MEFVVNVNSKNLDVALRLEFWNPGSSTKAFIAFSWAF